MSTGSTSPTDDALAALAIGRRRAGRRGRGRRRDRDGLPRVQGRDRDVVAGRRPGARRLDARRPRPGELRPSRAAVDRRGRRRGRPSRSTSSRAPRDPARRRRGAARSSSSSPPTLRSCPTSASGVAQRAALGIGRVGGTGGDVERRPHPGLRDRQPGAARRRARTRTCGRRSTACGWSAIRPSTRCSTRRSRRRRRRSSMRSSRPRR